MKIRMINKDEVILEMPIDYIAIDDSAVEVVTEDGFFYITSQFRKLSDSKTMVELEKYEDSEDIDNEKPAIESIKLPLEELKIEVMLNKAWEELVFEDNFKQMMG